MPKRDPADPGPVPSDKKPARLLVPLPKAQEELLRKTAKLASYTQGELLAAISESRAFANAAEAVLQQKYMERLRQGEELFKKTGPAKDPSAPEAT